MQEISDRLIRYSHARAPGSGTSVPYGRARRRHRRLRGPLSLTLDLWLLESSPDEEPSRDRAGACSARKDARPTGQGCAMSEDSVGLSANQGDEIREGLPSRVWVGVFAGAVVALLVGLYWVLGKKPVAVPSGVSVQPLGSSVPLIVGPGKFRLGAAGCRACCIAAGSGSTSKNGESKSAVNFAERESILSPC